MAAFLAATFFTGAFLAVPFFIGVFDFFFGRAGFAFPDLRTTFFADLAGFALAEPALPVLSVVEGSEVEGEAFALGFDALGFAVDADRPDFFPLTLGFSRALVAIVLYLLILCGVRIKEPLLYCTIGRMAALSPRPTLTYLNDKPRVSLRNALPCIPLSQYIRGSYMLQNPMPKSPSITDHDQVSTSNFRSIRHGYDLAFSDKPRYSAHPGGEN